MHSFHRTLKFINRLPEGTPIHIDPQLREALNYTDTILRQLLSNGQYAENILISARVHGTNMSKLHDDLVDLLRARPAIGSSRDTEDHR
jgi:hypothetical protein